MKVASLRAALVLATAVSGWHCQRGTPDTWFAEAERLRATHERAAGEAAIILYDRAASTWGAGTVNSARAGLGRALVLQQLGRLTDAVAAFKQAAAEAHDTGDQPLEARARGHLGYLLAWTGTNVGDFDRAERECQRAETIADQLEGRPELAGALACEAEVIYFRGLDLDRALELQRRVEAIWREVNNPRGVAQALYAQGYLYSDLRRFEQAQQSLESALDAWSAVGDARGTAITIVGQARLMERRGDYQASMSAYQRALQLLQPMGDVVREASCLAGIATIHRYLADNTAALENYEKALAVATTSGLKLFEWDMLTAVGETLLSMGDDQQALRYFDRAIDLATALDNPRLVSWALAYAGGARLIRREYQPAIETFERAADLLRSVDEKWLEARVLSGLGEAAEHLDRASDARRYFAEAVAVSETAGDRTGAATGLLALGDLATRQGRYPFARTTLLKALDAFMSLYGPSHPLVAKTRASLAGVDLANARLEGAVREAIDAERISLDHLRLSIRYLPERPALAFATRRPRGLDLAISAAIETRQSLPDLYELVFQSRGAVLDELAARGRSRAETDAQHSAVPNADPIRQRYANLLVRSLDGSVSQSELDAARLDMEAVERAVAARVARAQGNRDGPMAGGGTAVRQALPRAAALVSFVQFNRHRPSKAGAAPEPSVPWLAAFVVKPTAPVALVPLGRVSDLERLIAAWRLEAGGRSFTDPSAAADADRVIREVGLRLRALVWDPVAPYLEGASRVFVVPDGVVSLVPLGALPGAAGGYLIESGALIHYLTTERDILDRPRAASTATGILALGNPAFDARPQPAARPMDGAGAAETLRGASPCGHFQQIRFTALDGTRLEVQDISALWPSTLGSRETRVGQEASEQAFKEAAARHRVLHLATHGFFLDGACLPTAEAGPTRGVGALAVATPAENPLRLSGLALAGANRRAEAKPDEDDGILTAEEVAMLDLQGVEWAVLSACDTGVGEIKAGEGVFGLRRAFQVAGARTVIMSLWSVEDQATRAWMRALYEGRFQRKLSTADAVHQASLTVLRDRRARGQSTHPFFWAAFVAAGDWR